MASTGVLLLNVGVHYKEHCRVRIFQDVMWMMSERFPVDVRCRVAGWDRRVLALVHWSGSPHPGDPPAFQRRLDRGTEMKRYSWWNHWWTHLEPSILLKGLMLIPESRSQNVGQDPDVKDGVREAPTKRYKRDIMWEVPEMAVPLNS